MITPISLKNLRKLRRTWEEIAEDESLIDIQGSVGLILHDVVGALKLDSEQRRAVLGDRLVGDISIYIEQAMIATNHDQDVEIIQMVEGQLV